MKKLITLALLLICLVSFSQKATVDQTYGYKDIKFGTDIKDLTGRVNLVIDDEDTEDIEDIKHLVANYIIKDEKYTKLGGCTLNAVQLSTFDNKICMIALATVDNANSKCLLNYLNETYGPGKISTVDGWTSKWKGNLVEMEYTEGDDKKAAAVIMLEHKLFKEKNKYIQEVMKEMIKDSQQ